MKIDYVHQQQLSSFYVGCELLKALKMVSIDFNFKDIKNTSVPFIYGKLGSYTFAIDCLDGYNWIGGSIGENLKYFKENVKVDFLFKRNFNQDMIDSNPNISIIPFGFNYPIGLKYPSWKSILRKFSKNPYWAIRYFRLLSGYHDYRAFECMPDPLTPLKILYQVRLWDPNGTKDVYNQEVRKQLNQFRIDCVRLLKKCFPKNSVTGVEDSNLARELCPDLILSPKESSREIYFQLIRKSAIGITSNGLHHSIGWKMGEYIAASRAIVCEKPYFLFPSNFLSGQNYKSFSTPDELGIVLDRMLSNPKSVQEMMRENQNYYDTYQRPDRLVWNILQQIK